MRLCASRLGHRRRDHHQGVGWGAPVECTGRPGGVPGQCEQASRPGRHPPGRGAPTPSGAGAARVLLAYGRSPGQDIFPSWSGRSVLFAGEQPREHRNGSGRVSISWPPARFCITTRRGPVSCLLVPSVDPFTSVPAATRTPAMRAFEARCRDDARIVLRRIAARREGVGAPTRGRSAWSGRLVRTSRWLHNAAGAICWSSPQPTPSIGALEGVGRVAGWVDFGASSGPRVAAVPGMGAGARVVHAVREVRRRVRGAAS